MFDMQIYKKLLITFCTSFLLGCQLKPINKTESVVMNRVEVSVISTIHGFHFKTEDYAPINLKKIIESYKPDLVLVEIRPEKFLLEEYEDGPIEMTYITAVSKKNNIAVAAIDWWKEEDLEKKGEELAPEQDLIFNSQLEALGWKNIYQNFSFQWLNSVEFQNKVLLTKQLFQKWKQDPVWPIRQENIHQNTIKAIDNYQPKRVLVFVGAEHKAELDIFLSKMHKIKLKSALDFSKIVKSKPTENLDEQFKIEILKSKKRMVQKLDSTNDSNLKKYLNSKISQIDLILERFY